MLAEKTAQTVEIDSRHTRANKCAQEDEILVLQSVFEGGFSLLVPVGDQEAVFTLHLQVHNETPIPVKLQSENHYEQSITLPDLKLQIKLPHQYPSDCIPDVTVGSCVWHGAAHIQDHLNTAIRKIFQQNEPVLYEFAEFVRFEFSKLLPGGIQFEDANDMEAFLDASVQKQKQTFLNDYHQCGVCFDEIKGSEMVPIGCAHNYCRACVTNFIGIHIQEGTLAKLTCPYPECDCTIGPHIVRELCIDEDWERYERFSLEQCLDKMGDVKYCPKCQSRCVADDEDLCQCVSCFFAFCPQCQLGYHPATTCSEEIQCARKKVTNKKKGDSPLDKAQTRMRILEEEYASFLAISNLGARSCPGCHLTGVRVSGCAKMTCRCGVRWCYLCGKDISEEGYTHFEHGQCSGRLYGTGSTSNKLFQKQAQNIRQQFINVVKEVTTSSSRCPTCRELLFKVGKNNNITCKSCKSSFCAYCGKSFLRASEHFGPTGCKQHS